MSRLEFPEQVVIAHQGGWDEFLLMGLVAGGTVAFLRWSERRARRRGEEAEDEEGELGP
ncbi:MAG: hypothetical protein M3N51_12440 [Actinomycetota bacterium]|nr:hypothetical protein [Actinomycetota bacterium]